MAKYQADAQALLAYIGGRENIRAVTHCMTRMRFALADPARAQVEKIGAIPAVKGTFTQAGQFQVIIGNDVAAFYREFTALAGVEGVSKEAVKQAARENQPLLQRAVGALGEIFAPIIPALICGGLILGVRNIIGEIGLFDGGTLSLSDVSPFWAGVYSFLWLIGEAVFHMLPVGIVWSITRKMGTTQILGIVLGLTLVSPQLLNGYAVAGAESIPVWDFGFVQVQMIGYQGQVISAILAGFVLVWLEKFFKRICPEVVSMVLVPFCSLVPAVLIAHTVVGPIGWKIGDVIAWVVYAGLTSPGRWLFAALFGLLYAPLVLTGLHHMTNAIDSQLVNLYEGTILWPMIALSNIAQGSAVLAMAVLQRRDQRAQQVNLPACISCYLGVTEPALFGVNLKYGFPLVCGMVGSALAAAISVAGGVEAYSIGVGGLPGILSIKPQFWLTFLVAMGVAILVPFALTFLLGRRKMIGQEPQGQAAPIAGETAGALKAPLSGRVIPLEDIPDQVFSQGVLGEGVGIQPTGNVVLAPAGGEVTTVMEGSGHACGLLLEDGVEVLIHVGIDTVSMGGRGFQLHVKEGERVRPGDRLITFDPEEIRRAGLSPVTAFVVTEPAGHTFRYVTGVEARAGQTELIIRE